jgi:hypothetical protein
MEAVNSATPPPGNQITGNLTTSLSSFIGSQLWSIVWQLSRGETCQRKSQTAPPISIRGIDALSFQPLSMLWAVKGGRAGGYCIAFRLCILQIARQGLDSISLRDWSSPIRRSHPPPQQALLKHITLDGSEGHNSAP